MKNELDNEIFKKKKLQQDLDDLKSNIEGLKHNSADKEKYEKLLVEYD